MLVKIIWWRASPSIIVVLPQLSPSDLFRFRINFWN